MTRRLMVTVGALLGIAVFLFLFLQPRPAPDPDALPELAQRRLEGSLGKTSTAAVRPRSSRSSTSAAGSGDVLRQASGKVVIRAAWGSALGEVGRRHDPESSPEAPMAISIDGEDLLVLDQVNGRVQRFRRGVAVSAFATSDTAHDLATAPGGATVTLDRHVDRAVHVYDATGQPTNSAPIAGPRLEEAALATGVYAGEDGIWVEREHGSIVRVADAEGNAAEDRDELPGRPTRGGRALVNAAITDAAAGTLIVTAFDRSNLEVRWSRELSFEAMIVQIVMLDSTGDGNVYVAAMTAREGPPPELQLEDAAIRVVRLSATGEVTGRLDLPALDSGDEMLRPMTVGDDGAIYLMVPSDTGLQVLRYTF